MVDRSGRSSYRVWYNIAMSSLIIIHVVIAIVTFTGAGLSLVTGKWSRQIARGLVSGTGLTIVSGSVLLMTVPGASLDKFCMLTGLMVAVIAAAWMRSTIGVGAKATGRE